MREHDPDVIPRSEREQYSERDWGASMYVVGDEELEALREGKLLAMFSGEYTTFVKYEDTDA